MPSPQESLKSLEKANLPITQRPQELSNAALPLPSPLISLPSEILVQIAGYIILPQILHICNPESAQAASAPPFPSRPPGFTYLMTCRRTYTEGVALFYTQTTFYLPPGPVEHTNTYLTKILAPSHHALIRHFGMQLSWSDLAPSDIERCFKLKHSTGAHVARQLVKVWTKKAACAMGQWPPTIKYEPGAVPTMEMVCIPGSEGAVLGRSRLSPRWSNAASEVQVAVGKSTAWVRWVVGRKINDVGREGTKKWLLEVVGGGSGEAGDSLVGLGKSK